MEREKLEIYEQNVNVAIELLKESYPNNEVIDRLEELVDDIGYVLENTKDDASFDIRLNVLKEIGEELVQLPVREVLQKDGDDTVRVVVTDPRE